MRLNKSAVQKLETAKPSTILAQSMIISALMTRRNNPKVIKVTGNVRSTRIGFMNKFNNPKTTATIIAVTKLSDESPCVPPRKTPGMKCAMTITKTAVIKILMSRFISLLLKFIKCNKLPQIHEFLRN